jgi:serine/threonine protein kinase
MSPLSDKVVASLKNAMQQPDLSGTRYKVVHYLARGGMGSVWLAEDEVLGRRVALKVLDLVPPADDMPARLVQEAHVLARLEHPGIVPVHEAGTLPDGRAYYCMKYVEGKTLEQALAGKSVADRLRLLQRIAEPVEFAHAAGFIHRDLKPENIMLGAFGEVLVMDWGLAKLCGSDRAEVVSQRVDASPPGPARLSETQQGSVLGTPGYMSPEQMRGDRGIDHRSDIFSLGAILWFMLAGSSPAGKGSAIVSVPKALHAICNKAMAADPGDRYQSARDMMADVAHYLDGEPVSAYPEGLMDRGRRIVARHHVAVILVAVYLLMRILFIFLARS